MNAEQVSDAKMPTVCLDLVDMKPSPEIADQKYEVENSSSNRDETNLNHGETTQKKSPNTSLCSQIISITTLDDNDDSSVAESDVEFDADNNSNNQTMVQNLGGGNGILLMNGQSDDGDRSILSSASNSALRPNIGSIAVQNSSDITFGNKTFYQGPVTIKQFMYDNQRWRPSDQANDNPAYNSSGDVERTDGKLG